MFIPGLERGFRQAMRRVYASQDSYQRNNYASNYAAKNVKNALDKLIGVLQSPEHVQRLVIGQASRRPPTTPSKVSLETPAKTPLWMETSASVTKRSHNSDAEKLTTPSSSNNPSDKRKTKSVGSSGTQQCSDSGCPPGCSLSQYVPLAHLLCGSEGKYISLDRYEQMWARSLREYPVGGSIRPVPTRYRQRSAPPPLEVMWNCAPCKPGYIEEIVI